MTLGNVKLNVYSTGQECKQMADCFAGFLSNLVQTTSECSVDCVAVDPHGNAVIGSLRLTSSVRRKKK